ncbi:MAG: alpha-L-fucosidase [Desulfocapsa sp.]|nr:alpha-L-fucosidase [Desulfocapsa sp.]
MVQGFQIWSLHYLRLVSLQERGEWVQWDESIPVSEYEKLKDKFSAENFDADFLTDMALKAEMKYVLIVARYHDSFCIFLTPSILTLKARIPLQNVIWCRN